MSDARRGPGFGIRDSGLGSREAASQPPCELDAAIDAVAREMTDAEPSAGLRANVLDAIERGGRDQSPALPRWVWATAAAGILLAVAVATWLSRPVQVPPAAGPALAEHHAAVGIEAGPGHAETAATADVAASPATMGPPHLGAAMTPAVNLAAARSGRGRRDDQIEPDAAREAVALLPALPDIAPLALSDVEPAPLGVSDVDLAPLNVAPMDDILALEDRSTDNRPFARNLEERR